MHFRLYVLEGYQVKLFGVVGFATQTEDDVNGRGVFVICFVDVVLFFVHQSHGVVEQSAPEFALDSKLSYGAPESEFIDEIRIADGFSIDAFVKLVAAPVQKCKDAPVKQLNNILLKSRSFFFGIRRMGRIVGISLSPLFRWW